LRLEKEDARVAEISLALGRGMRRDRLRARAWLVLEMSGE
jgi:hypothetical protein